VARREDDAVIGTTTIFQLDYVNRRGEIGFAIERGHWGRGYASDAVTTLLRFAFEQLSLHRLEADPDPRNAASIRVLRKQGFVREGLLRERYLLNGEAQDAEYYGLLRREWTAS
jgi:RimJ/RimL family protein N-acetyltransferase